MLTHFTLTQPLSLDNALSSFQIIHKLITQMNKVIDEINSIDSKANEYTDREILKLHNEINNDLNTLQNLLQSQIDVNSLDIDNLKTRATHLESELVRIETKIDGLREYVDENIVVLRREINTVYHTLIALMNELKQYVEDLIKKMTVKVYSNYDGCKKDIKDALNDLYNFNKRRYANSEVSFKFIKDVLGVQVNNSPNSTSNYMYIKDILTFAQLKTIANTNTITNIFIPLVTSPNPVDPSNSNDWLNINYYSSNLFKYFKFDFMIFLYAYICTSSVNYNNVSGSSVQAMILYNNIATGMRSYLGCFNYKTNPYTWFGWNVYY